MILTNDNHCMVRCIWPGSYIPFPFRSCTMRSWMVARPPKGEMLKVMLTMYVYGSDSNANAKTHNQTPRPSSSSSLTARFPPPKLKQACTCASSPKHNFGEHNHEQCADYDNEPVYPHGHAVPCHALPQLSLVLICSTDNILRRPRQGGCSCMLNWD